MSSLSVHVLHQEHLLHLQGVDADTVLDFCRVALQFLQNGIQLRLVEKAAKKLDWPPEKLQSILQALMELLRNVASQNLSEDDLSTKLSSIGLQPEHVAVLLKFIAESLPEVRAVLTRLSFQEVRLKNLEWRFEVEIASRTLHNQHKPMFLINLELQTSTATKSHVLQLDIPMLLHLTEEIELALSEGRSAHVRRTIRHVK